MAENFAHFFTRKIETIPESCAVFADTPGVTTAYLTATNASINCCSSVAFDTMKHIASKMQVKTCSPDQTLCCYGAAKQANNKGHLC